MQKKAAPAAFTSALNHLREQKEISILLWTNIRRTFRMDQTQAWKKKTPTQVYILDQLGH